MHPLRALFADKQEESSWTKIETMKLLPYLILSFSTTTIQNTPNSKSSISQNTESMKNLMAPSLSSTFTEENGTLLLPVCLMENQVTATEDNKQPLSSGKNSGESSNNSTLKCRSLKTKTKLSHFSWCQLTTLSSAKDQKISLYSMDPETSIHLRSMIPWFMRKNMVGLWANHFNWS